MLRPGDSGPNLLEIYVFWELWHGAPTCYRLRMTAMPPNAAQKPLWFNGWGDFGLLLGTSAVLGTGSFGSRHRPPPQPGPCADGSVSHRAVILCLLGMPMPNRPSSRFMSVARRHGWPTPISALIHAPRWWRPDVPVAPFSHLNPVRECRPSFA